MKINKIKSNAKLNLESFTKMFGIYKQGNLYTGAKSCGAPNLECTKIMPNLKYVYISVK